MQRCIWNIHEALITEKEESSARGFLQAKTRGRIRCLKETRVRNFTYWKRQKEEGRGEVVEWRLNVIHHCETIQLNLHHL